ncbi:uncharacterized protein si:ch211-106e7.2 isoform X2 [Dunckerocampus dactyliophorus]|uniref:uncharacterized protein si:ch211-106e7.2 isoform X2 n=1 Tax=Dunckerocampus dactyliophorus TaxID=161453 RepID=UPI0024059E26|nr:uncharacterized protein si:ch211-106e7.2 isoform X2 [Dunckerocampus dactyliophorus]
MMKMLLAWINGQYQILGPRSHPSAEHAHNTVNPGPTQTAVFYNGGHYNEPKSNCQITQVPHQTVGGNNVYQMPHVTFQNPFCNLQGRQPFPVTKPTPPCQNDMSLYRNQSYYLHDNGSTGTQAFSLSSVQHTRINQGMYQVANQAVSKTGVSSTTATALNVRQGIGGVESNISLVNNAVHGLHPYNHSGPHSMASSVPCYVASSFPSSTNIPNAFSSNEKTQPLSTLFDGTNTNGSPAAGSQHNSNGTRLQASTDLQTTTGQQNDSLKKKRPATPLTTLLTQLLLEPSPHKQNDKSNSSREVAVVHPLTSSCNKVNHESKCPTPPESLSFPIVDKEKNMQQEHCWSSHEISSEPQSKQCQSMPTQATIYAPDTVTKDHCFRPSDEKLVIPEAPEKDKGDNNKGQDMPPDPKASIYELSSLPTTLWTLEELLNLLEPERLEELSDQSKNLDFRRQILSLFWDNSLKNMITVARTTYYRDVLKEVGLFCLNLKEDTVVLSQVQPSVISQLKNVQVLKHGEVYSELPYNSSWLNKNEQLDDIDKEFGPNIHQLLSVNLSDEVPTVNVPSQPASAVPKPIAEPEDGSTHSDPLYSFEIKVLPPEEAKAIFEQGNGVTLQCMETLSEPEPVPNTAVVEQQGNGGTLQCMETLSEPEPVPNTAVVEQQGNGVTLQCMETLSEPEPVPNTAVVEQQGNGVTLQCMETLSEPEPVPNTAVVDEPLKDRDVTSSSHMETNIQQFCCIEKWKEILCGSETLLDKCKCGQVCDLRKSNSENEGKSDQMDCKELIILPDLQPHSLLESKSEDKTISSIPISWLEICNKVSQTFDLSNYNEETDDLNKLMLNESQPTIIVENKAANISSSEKDLHNQMSDDEDCEAPLKPAERCQSTDSDFSGEETLVLPVDGNCEQAQNASSDIAKSPWEQQMSCHVRTGGQTAIGLTQTHESESRKRKRQSSPDTLFPSLKKLIQKRELDSHISKSSKISVPGTDCEPSVPGKTVQLVLFGSLPRERRSISKRCQETAMPPEVVYAHISPLKRKPAKCASTLDYSATKRIRNKMRSSPGKKKHRIKLKAKNTILSSTTGRQKKNSQKSSINHKDFDAELTNSAHNDRRKNECGTQALLSIQENVLKFSVLPNSFSFEDELKGKKETTECCPADVWGPLPGKEYYPEPHRATSRSSNVFAEFQKKYMEMSQLSITR